MPLPLVLALIAGGTAAVGIGKGIKAGIDQSDANSTNARANRIAEDAVKEANTFRDNCGKAINDLGKIKIAILNGSIASYVESFEKIAVLDIHESAGLAELQKFNIDKQSLVELKDMQTVAASVAGGIVGGAAAGAVTAFGACSAVALLGTASTGTAIATLTGAAATNATLAFLGGGSLAAGGLGIAGGTCILGGLAAGPLLSVMGFVVGAKASENKDNAYANLAKAEELEEQMSVVKAMCKGIRMRTTMFERFLLKLNAIFEPLVYKLEDIIREKGTDFSNYSQEERNIIIEAEKCAKIIKLILDTPLLTDDGKLSEDSDNVIPKINNYLEDKNVRMHEVR